jgi:bifunctional DNase/RNase
MVPVIVQGVAPDPNSGTSVVLLREVNGERTLPIWVGPGEAAAISMRLNGVQRDRPLTHDLAASFVTALGGHVSAARIHSWEGKTYFAEVVLERGGEVVAAVDSRPSDAISIALRTGADILVADHLFRPRAPTADALPAPP